MKKYREKDSYKEMKKKYREENIEKHRKYARDWAIKFRSSEEGRKRMKELSSTKHRKEAKNEYRRKKLLSDVNFRIVSALRRRMFMAIKNNQKGGSAVKDLGCSISELKEYLEKKFQEGMNWSNHGLWHIDHIRPLSSFDLTDRGQFTVACNYRNLQPLWAKDNLSKGAKL